MQYFHTPEYLTSLLADYRAQLPQVRRCYAETGDIAHYRSSRGLWLKMTDHIRRELDTHTVTGREDT